MAKSVKSEIKKETDIWGRLEDAVAEVCMDYDLWVGDMFSGPIFSKEFENFVSTHFTASAKKSMNKSKYPDIQKRLNKIGGFTKEDEDEDDHDGKVEVEVEVENEGDDDESPETVTDEIEEACKDTKSKKTVKGMRANKKRMKMKEDEDDDDKPNPLDEDKNILGEDVDYDEDYTRDWADFSQRKSRKTKKAEDMPADADDFQNDNQKGSGNAGSELPEEANDQQDVNEKGSGNAGSELPEDADEQENIKESARKTRKSMNRPPVRKFSVTPGGQPNQESYNQRYSQAPMVREAIDGHMSSRANKSFDEIAMMNERIEALTKSKRNPSGNNGVPKRIR